MKECKVHFSGSFLYYSIKCQWVVPFCAIPVENTRFLDFLITRNTSFFLSEVRGHTESDGKQMENSREDHLNQKHERKKKKQQLCSHFRYVFGQSVLWGENKGKHVRSLVNISEEGNSGGGKFSQFARRFRKRLRSCQREYFCKCPVMFGLRSINKNNNTNDNDKRWIMMESKA